MKKAAVYVNPKTLVPWEKNPRFNDDAVEKVKNSISLFGFASPIIAQKSTGRVIAGHTRLKASLSLALKEVPVRYMDLDDKQASALAIADNRLTEIALWDEDQLEELLRELQGDFNMEDLGFSASEMEFFLKDSLLELPPENDTKAMLEDTGKVTVKVVTSFHDGAEVVDVIKKALADNNLQAEVVF